MIGKGRGLALTAALLAGIFYVTGRWLESSRVIVRNGHWVGDYEPSVWYRPRSTEKGVVTLSTFVAVEHVPIQTSEQSTPRKRMILANRTWNWSRSERVCESTRTPVIRHEIHWQQGIYDLYADRYLRWPRSVAPFEPEAETLNANSRVTMASIYDSERDRHFRSWGRQGVSIDLNFGTRDKLHLPYERIGAGLGSRRAFFRSIRSDCGRRVEMLALFQGGVKDNSLNDQSNELERANENEKSGKFLYTLLYCFLIGIGAGGIFCLGLLLLSRHLWLGWCVALFAFLILVTDLGAFAFGSPIFFWTLTWLR